MQARTQRARPQRCPLTRATRPARCAALVIEGAERTTVSGCSFSSLGGNALLVNRYARHTSIIGNDFQWIGDSAILVVGSSQLIDATDGDHPQHSLIEGNTIREVGGALLRHRRA